MKKRFASALKSIAIPTLLVIVFGFALTCIVVRLTTDAQRRTTDAVANELGEHFEESFSTTEKVLDGIRAQMLSDEAVTAQKFATYAGIVYGEPKEITALEWIDAGNVVRFVYPLEGENLKAVGFDNNEFPNRLAPILQAKELRKAMMTRPIMLAQGYPGVIVFMPVFNGDQYVGASVAVVRLSTLLKKYTSMKPYSDYRIAFSAGDRMIKDDGTAIFTLDGKRVTTPVGDPIVDPSAPTIASTGHAEASTSYLTVPWKILIAYEDDPFTPFGIVTVSLSALLVIFTFAFLVALERKNFSLKEAIARERDFTSLVSHQLRAPLTELNWMIDAVDEPDTAPQERSKTLADMRNIVRQGAHTINELLALSRIERGVLEMKIEETAIATMMNDVLLPLRGEAKARGVNFILDIPPALTANVDEGKLIEALRNIVDNALKYGPPEKPVTITAARNDGKVIVTVTDLGPGIPAEFRDKIFDKASAFTKKGTTEGAGLGLYLTKSLVNLMGGTVHFETSEQGTTFIVAVPASGPGDES